jgi:HEAT repeat protein
MAEFDEIIGQLGSSDAILRHEAVSRLGRCGDKRAIDKLVSLLRDPAANIRDEAVNSLINIGGEDAAKAVVPLLYDDEIYVCNMACEILVRLGDASLRSVTGLLGEEDVDVLKYVIDVIGLIGNDEPVERMLPLLKHENPNIRAAVAVTLGKLRASGAIERLVDLINDPDEWVKFSALEAIGEIGGKKITDTLLDVFKGEDISRIAAIDALSMLADGSDAAKVMPVLKDNEMAGLLSVETLVRFIERFEGTLADSGKKAFIEALAPRLMKAEAADFEIAREVLRGFSVLGDPRAMAVLLEFAGTKNYDEDTRAMLKDAIIKSGDLGRIVAALKVFSHRALVFVEALAEVADPSTVGPLSDLLAESKDSKVRRVIVEALGTARSPGAYGPLVAALKDPDGTVRKFAAKGLAGLGDARAVEALFSAMTREGEYDDVKDAIGDALAEFEGDRVEGLFVDLLKGRDFASRAVAVRGLGKLSTERARTALAGALNDNDPQIRCEAVRAIGYSGGAGLAGLVIKALDDADKDVRLTALDIVAWLPDADPHVTKSLRDADVWVRFRAASLAAEKAIASAEDELIERLKTDEIPVKVASAKALGAIRSKKAIKTLTAFLNHEDANLSSAAADALQACGEA